MAKNNHNAGMHFVKHSNSRQYDNLSYYNQNSVEGIQNRKNNVLAQLEAMGEYNFTEYISSIDVITGNNESACPKRYRVLRHEEQYEEQLKHVSTKCKLRICNNEEEVVAVRVHDEQRIIYISKKNCEKIMDKGRIYRLFSGL